MTTTRWMIYGANGYSGRLIAREAKARGLNPILAGRSAAVNDVAAELGFDVRTFSLDDADATRKGLEGIGLVLHCAGPFSHTSRAMLDACIAARAHYLDITGEVEVFEAIFARSDELVRAGITAIPGVGFDVVPTDFVAARLKERLPEATRLVLGMKTSGKVSPGTTKSMIEGIGQGGYVRRAGQVVRVPLAAQSRRIEFVPGRPQWAVQVPWGDMVTAFHTTGIPNIEVFSAMPRAQVRVLRSLAVLTRAAWIRNGLLKWAGKHVKGDSEHELGTRRCVIWGEASAPGGRTESMRLNIPHGYRFTAISAVAAAEAMLARAPKPGALTPTLAFGTGFCPGLPGVEVVD